VLWRAAGKLPHARLRQEFATLGKQAAKDFQEEDWGGRVHYQPSVDIRYRGQGYELNLPFTKNLLKEFEKEHRRRYGYAHPAREVELVTLRLRASVKSPPLQASSDWDDETAHVGTATPGRPGRSEPGRLSPAKAPVLFDGKKVATAIYFREALTPGKKYSGPAIITEYSATTVVPPGKHFHLDSASNLIVTIR
jgi:N-methylhydantoinase A